MLKKIIGIFYTILNISLICGLQVGINTSGKSYYVNEIQTGGNGFACATFPENHNSSQIPYPVSPIPPGMNSFDITSGINLSPVQNQNNPYTCNACYAFAITSWVEIMLQYNESATINYFPITPLPPMKLLSSQQIIDCYTPTLPNTGANCISGDIYAAVNYLVGLNTTTNSGLCSDEDYPYQGFQSTCQFSNGKCPNGTSPLPRPYYVDFTNSYVNSLPGQKFIETKNFKAADLKGYIYRFGPVIVGIDMPAAFKYYSSSSGIYTAGCGTNINSVVLIVGFNSDDLEKPYWIARTSFGSDWGINGNIHIDASLPVNGTDPNSKYGKCGIYKYGIILSMGHINPQYPSS